MSAVIELPTAKLQDPDYMGGCPVCHRYSGVVHIDGDEGVEHWAICEVHRTCWFAGTNLFSEVGEPEDRRRWYDMLRNYRGVEAWHPPAIDSEAT